MQLTLDCYGFCGTDSNDERQMNEHSRDKRGTSSCAATAREGYVRFLRPSRESSRQRTRQSALSITPAHHRSAFPLSLITILRSLHSRQRIGFPSKSAAVRGGRCRSARDQTRMRPSNEHVANSQPRTCARITAYASKRIRKHTATPVAASVCSRSEYSMDPSRRLHIFIVLSCEA
jgi:hypothetical protein